MKIPYVNLKAQWDSEKREILPIIEKTLSKGQFVNGSEINQFEKTFLKFVEPNMRWHLIQNRCSYIRNVFIRR